MIARRTLLLPRFAKKGASRPGPLRRFLAEHIHEEPGIGYSVNEASSRKNQPESLPLFGTKLTMFLHFRSTTGDRAASELLADELARREKDLAPET